ncbi:nucleoside triphosphate pyrophosphohydrolase [Crocosphaera sp. UHCC 0190]|uniref:nucleoside triphosphate pyrophosphohydrolase n=1 Tax=Crocosphaera sp. UHCC 0190 TaxID=3110246 RepID=UPI002B1F20D9|nr:nucleoside triphosphate pyrophosphohydrolase [Crocosphaera sp. UHCC 0190]MEA5509687.1 nucleoside triphosphate pyrophosphohydrolase [Crocosphaera sp. UHCC 0190]
MSKPQTAPNQTYHAILETLNHLIEVVAKLRSPDGGCPWDLAQTPQTLIPYIIEEAYEVVHAIRSEDQNAIAEELGDLLLQVVLQAQIADDHGHFNLKEVAQGITEKLIRRHPHVFGDVTVKDGEEVGQNWEKIKAEEKGETPEISQLLSRKLAHYNRTLPPLMASSKISIKAAKAGFEWENIEGVWDKFSEELAEFKEALETDNQEHQQSELGDLLFTIINLARWYGLDASEALAGTNERFIQRLSKMETFADRPLTDYSLEELENLWQQAKKKLNQ